MLLGPTSQAIINTCISFSQHKMFNTKNIIISLAIISFFGITTVSAFGTPDYNAKIVSALDASKAQKIEAKRLYCVYIGVLTQKCYAKNAPACTELATKEVEYQTEFSLPSSQDCFSEAQNTDSNTSLFLGDEGNLPQ